MTEKRYDVIDKEEPRGQSVTWDGIPCTARTCVTRLNRLTEENRQLKAQLQKGEDVCSICKHQYLTETSIDRYYIAKCKKEHDECSRGTVNYCEDFECKELKE